MLFFPTADEDFQYFRSQGYDGSINDMHYKALGDLGYTGSLNDRIHKYLTEEYGSYYEAMRGLRNGTLTFSLSSLSAYAVNNFEPSLVFDFEQSYYRTGGTDSTLSSSVTHTRASSATMTNSSGNIVTVGNNVARVGHHIYNGSAWVNEGVLHESEARTNLLNYSSMESTYWNFQSGSRSATTWVLTGASDATTITTSTNTGGTGNRIYKTGIAGGSGVTCSVSFYYKANTTVPFIHFRVGNGNGNGVGACINTATGALTTGYRDGANSLAAFATQNVENVGSGWRRFTATFPTLNTNQSFIMYFSDSSATTAAGFDGTETIDVAGCQYEIGSTPSSYIPTSGSTVTRAAETLTVPAANMPWPTPVVIGNELITNGTFDSNTNDWTVSNSTLSVDSNKLKVTSTGSFGHAEQDFTTVSGKVYSFTANYIAGDVDGYVQLEDRNGGGTIYSDYTNAYQTDKTVSVIFTAVSNLTRINLYNRFGSAGNFNFWDNISVKEINPLSVSIQMDGRMTGENLTPIRWLEDANNAILLESGTNNFTFTQEASGTVDTVTGGSFTSGTFVTFNTSSRHGSTFINGAIDGTALTANTTPVALPDLSTTDLELGYDFMGTIGKLRVWSDDLTDTGIEEAST